MSVAYQANAPPASIEEAYATLAANGSTADRLRSLVALRHWFHELGEFDQLTGELMPRSLSELCHRVLGSQSNLETSCKDRLQRVLDHVHEPLLELIHRPVEKLLREQAMLPVRAARELDTSSFMALSRRPGRTIREKLAGKPYLQAIRRRPTLDTTENRLMKALCLRLAELLRLRQSCFGNAEPFENTELLQALDSWLHGPDAREIGHWSNLPPNNTLLQHRAYRRLWNGWRWLQSIDDTFRHDWEQQPTHWATTLFWSIIAHLKRHFLVRLPEQPCTFDYDKLQIRPALTATEVWCHIDGLLFPWLPPGRQLGKVIQIGKDKDEKGYGFATTADGSKVFFHSDGFLIAEDFDIVRVGAHLVFTVSESKQGGLKGTKIAPHDNHPVPFKIDLNDKLEINLIWGRGETRTLFSIDREDLTEHRIEAGRPISPEHRSSRSAHQVATSTLSTFLPSEWKLDPETKTHRKSKYAVIDFTNGRPQFRDDAGKGAMPFRLLWQLWQRPGMETTEIDLGETDAIALNPNANIVSILDLLGSVRREGNSVGILSRAARHFSQRIHEALQTDSLTYLIPDAADDFSLETLRASLNARFPKAEPLPRSIAAVFDWQSSKQFYEDGLKEGDCVLVLDTVAGFFSVTPLIARYNKRLSEELPKTHGIHWERHPTIRGDDKYSSISMAVKTLKDCGCSSSDTMGSLFGLQGIVDEAGRISWINEDRKWSTITSDLKARLGLTQHKAAGDAWECLVSSLKPFFLSIPGESKLFVIPTGDTPSSSLVPPPPALLDGRQAARVKSIQKHVRGASVLREWQRAAGCFPLWCDHLPELAVRIRVNGRLSLFHLVKEMKPITPKRGAAVSIPIKDTFELEAGHPEYSFPLLQGSEGNALHFKAVLKSPAFPLQTNTPCRLALTYTYGEDRPYELHFFPIHPDQAEFHSVTVRWEEVPESADQHQLVPPFPLRASWADMRRYQIGNQQPVDLVDIIRRKLTLDPLIEAIAVFERSKTTELIYPPRSSGTIVTTNWDRGFCFVHTNSGDLFCHVRSFCESVDPDKLEVGTILFFDIAWNADGLQRCENISCNQEFPPTLEKALRRDLIRKSEAAATVEARKSLSNFRTCRNAILTAWNHGHNSGEPDFPKDLCQPLASFRSQYMRLSVLDQDNSSSGKFAQLLEDVTDSAFYLLCCFSADAPDEVYERVWRMDIVEVMRHWRRIGLLIGNAKQYRQEKLLQRCISRAIDGDEVSLQILGIAVWRAESLVPEMSRKVVEKLSDRLIGILANGKTIRQDRETGERFISPYVVSQLELCLALLRSRDSENEETRSTLAVESPLARHLEKVVEEIDKNILDSGLPMRSRIALQMDKPESVKSHDLLYALMAFLTGDTGANSISVTSIDDDE